jgi:hypothetical protein
MWCVRAFFSICISDLRDANTTPSAIASTVAGMTSKTLAMRHEPRWFVAIGWRIPAKPQLSALFRPSPAREKHPSISD